MCVCVSMLSLHLLVAAVHPASREGSAEAFSKGVVLNLELRDLEGERGRGEGGRGEGGEGRGGGGSDIN